MNERLLRLLNGNASLYPNQLERRYIRVLDNILKLWDTPQIKPYFFELLVSKPDGSTHNFPQDVVREIMVLSNVYDYHERMKAGAATGERKRRVPNQGNYPQISDEFMEYIERGNLEMVQKLLAVREDMLEARDEREWTPLMISSFNGNEKLALYFICRGAQIDVRDKNGYTPLHWTAYNGFDKVVDMLIREGADVNAYSDFGWTPLIQAATKGHVIVAMKLIAAGARINEVSDDGLTALHKAAANGHEQMVQLLLKKGADISIKSSSGNSALDMSETNKHKSLAEMLKEEAQKRTRP